jgi:endonuclease/exonuclease/phosphatase (EEP) superfamily protein YafD
MPAPFSKCTPTDQMMAGTIRTCHPLRYNQGMSDSTAPDNEISAPAAENSSVAEASTAAEASPAHPAATGQSRLRRIARLWTGAVALAAVGGLAGRAWWLFALAGTFRVQYFWGLLLGTALLLATGRRYAAFFAAMLLAFHGWLLLPFLATPSGPRLPQGTSAEPVRLRVVTLNVWARNVQHERVIDFLRQSSADIVVLEEVYPAWVPHLKALEADWPHHSSLTREVRYGMAIFSRWPLERARNEFLSEGAPVIAARVLVPETPLAIFGVHLSRPLTRAGSLRQAQQLAELPGLLKDKSLEQIVLGDFNAAPWNPRFCDFLSQAGLTDSRLGFGVHSSWPSGLPAALRIPIDHCLVSKNIRVVRHQLGPSVGSDHLPVIVDLEINGPIPTNESK